MPESYPWVWARCSPEPCWVWPIALVGNVGRCGICGQGDFVQLHHDDTPPRDMKAGPYVQAR